MTDNSQALDRAIELHQAGKLQQAEELYRQILQTDGAHADAFHLLGVVAHQTGRNEQAVANITAAIALKPAEAIYHNSLGAAYLALADHAAAVCSYENAIRLKPDFAKAHNNLGLALTSQGKLAEAVDALRQALRLQPDYVEAHVNLGNAFREQGKLTEAVECCTQALRLKPNYAEGHSSLGIALREQGNLEAAIASYRQALALKPNFAQGLNNLGNALKEQGKPQEALASYREALRLEPGFAEAHKSLAMTLLLLGKFEEGWTEYEWRWKCKEFSAPAIVAGKPLWDGSALEGKSILLWAEQGLGDSLQFIRYAALVRECGGKVVFLCPKPLSRVLAGCSGIDLLARVGEPLPDFDVHAPLLSLPRIMATTIETVPAGVPYLSPDAALVDRWRAALSHLTGFKIGIAWQGSPTYRGDRYRSIPLEHFEPLARVDGVRLVSLQKGAGVEQLRTVAERISITDLGSGLDESSGPFMDTAAVMKCLDLVITSDTAIAHLAGTLAVPVWVALPLNPDWRWLLDRDDSPWYPTMRLFRQTDRGNWQAVFARIASEVKRLAAGRARRD